MCYWCAYLCRCVWYHSNVIGVLICVDVYGIGVLICVDVYGIIVLLLVCLFV